MFERFIPAAREVVIRAQDEARALGHQWIGTEHLLLGVLAQPQAPGVSALTERGVTLTPARDAVSELVGRGGLGERDADALRSLGIDLDEVRRRTEETFGPGALDRPLRRRRRRRLPWLRQTCPEPDDAGKLPFMPRAKRVFEHAVHEAVSRGDDYLGVQHLLLGLLDPKGNMAIEVLRHLGIADTEALRRRVLAKLDEAA